MVGTNDSGAEAPAYCALDDRGVIAIEGPDARAFLQGVISNDVDKVTADRALWAAFLTPQGKYLHDFFLLEQGGRLLLETEAARLGDLLRRLKLYKLRSKVEVADVSAEWHPVAAWGPGVCSLAGLPAEAGARVELEDGSIAFVDPRRADLGLRVLRCTQDAPFGLSEGKRTEWERLRIALGLPDGSRDMEIEKALLLENGFDELGGVDWRKGCYMGQELTARTKYRGLVKKRLLPIEINGDPETEGNAIEQEGKSVGELKSRSGDRALALIRLQALEGTQPLTLAGSEVKVSPPDWIVLPQPGS